MTFHERKAERTAYYETYIKGWKQRKCTACNGSGYYDHNGSPPCGACNGTGKEWYKPQPGNQLPKE
jgi:DnaJ-class molecular chaperone